MLALSRTTSDKYATGSKINKTRCPPACQHCQPARDKTHAVHAGKGDMMKTSLPSRSTKQEAHAVAMQPGSDGLGVAGS